MKHDHTYGTNIKILTLNPGKIGIDINFGNGLICSIHEFDHQKALDEISHGWRIIKINDKAYDTNYFAELINGAENYTITCEQVTTQILCLTSPLAYNLILKKKNRKKNLPTIVHQPTP